MDLTTFAPRKILLCQLNQIGDVLLMTPCLELLARRFPGAEIHVVTEKKCLPMLENNPHVARIWPIDKKALPTLLNELGYYWRIARENYDLIVDFQQTPRCRWIVGFSRSAVRLTRTPHWYMRWLYSHWTEPDEGYAAAIKASFLKPLGITWNGEKPRLYLSSAERDWAAAYLAELGVGETQTLVSVDSTHRRATRCWPAASYAALMDAAARERPDLRFLLLYGPGEKDVIDELAALAENKNALLVPERVLTLREAAACIERAALHFGNCSAPRHMAVAVDTPSLTVMGATSPGWTYPAPEHGYVSLGLPCQPCNANTCRITPERECLVKLTPDNVLPFFLERLPAPE